MSIASIQNHVGYQKYIRPALIASGIVLAVATIALAILLFTPELIPALTFEANLALASGSAFLATLFLGATRQAPTAPAVDLPVYRADREPLVLSDPELPPIYEYLADVIRAKFKVEGTFREPGDKTRIENFIKKINRKQDPYADIEAFDIRDACSALKQLVERTRTQLKLDPSELNLEAAVKAFNSLIPVKKRLVKMSIELLALVKDNEEVTKMSASNLAVSAHSLILNTSFLDELSPLDQITAMKAINLLAEAIIENPEKFIID